MVVAVLSAVVWPVGPPVRWWEAGPFLSVLSCWFIWWCFSLLGDCSAAGRPLLDKQKGRGSRVSGSAAFEGACRLCA
jgi:hypothetical protein